MAELLARLIMHASLSVWLQTASPVDCATDPDRPACLSAERAERRRTMNPAVPDDRFRRSSGRATEPFGSP